MAELNTYGDLKKVIKSISLKQKGEKIGNVALDVVIGFIPGAEAAKTTFDFIKAAISKPDAKKTSTWLDKLDVDDKMSAIVDDTVENGFMQAMAKAIEDESDTKPLEPDFNMNAKMVNYLKQQYGGRHITGIQENKEMDLKAYIKELVQKELEEISATSGGEAYSTPFNFAKKGQKTNAAIQTAKSQGMKLVPTGIPSDSKVRDYKAIWKSAEKPKYKMYKESLHQIIKQELLNEVTYSKFKNEVKFRTKSEQLHKAIREVKRKLQEIDRIVEYTSRMKQELSEDGGLNYWKATQKNIGTISEMVNQLNNKIKNLHQ
jgi:hypothetical protein